MDEEINRIRDSIKSKRSSFQVANPDKKVFNKLQLYIIKTMVVFVLLLCMLIGLKASSKFRTLFYKEVYEKNISFAYINKIYKKYFGDSLPFKNLFKFPNEQVFNETLKYKEVSLYMDGAKLVVDDNYLVPSLEEGLVIFSGEKEGYGNVVIIQQTNSIDLWYGNLSTINVKLYDYIEKGSLLGEASENTLYLVFKKDGKVLNYEEYI